jgi:hypothetical protein
MFEDGPLRWLLVPGRPLADRILYWPHWSQFGDWPVADYCERYISGRPVHHDIDLKDMLSMIRLRLSTGYMSISVRRGTVLTMVQMQRLDPSSFPPLPGVLVRLVLFSLLKFWWMLKRRGSSYEHGKTCNRLLDFCADSCTLVFSVSTPLGPIFFPVQ